MIEHTPEYAALLAVLDTGELYVDYGPGLEEGQQARDAGKELAYDYNATRPSQGAERSEILGRLLGSVGADVWIEPPLRVSYGSHVFVGDGFYANFNCVLVDDAEIHIGARVMFGPNVTLTTAGHPVAPQLRVGGRQYSLPITIGDDVWIGSNVVILPGVSIGAGSVIGAGSIVTRDVPERVVALGNPCRVVRPIGPEDDRFTRRTTRPALPGQ